MSMDLSIDRITHVAGDNAVMIAVGAVAGTFLFASSRVVGAILGAGAVLAYALYSGPCCAGCAAGVGCGGTAGTSAAASVGLQEGSTSGRSISTMPYNPPPLTSDYVGAPTPSSARRASMGGLTDPSSLWSTGSVSSSSSSGCTGCS